MKFRSVIACLLAVALCLSGCGSSSDDIPYYTFEDFSNKYTLTDFITLGQYKKLEYDPIVVPEEELTDLLHQKLQESSYVSYSDDVITEGTVQEGDTCSIDYVGKQNGTPFPGGTGSNDLVIGSGTFIPGFEEGLIGKKIGSTVDLELTFPENYGNETLRGQDVIFTVTIHKVTSRKVYHELTDELAATLDSSVKTADEYMTKLEKQIYDQMDSNLTFSIWNTAVENATYGDDYPEELKDLAQATIQAYYLNVATQAGYETTADYLASQNVSDETYQTAVNNYTIQQCKHYLLALAVCEESGYTVPEEEFNSQAASAAAGSGYEDTESYLEAMGGDLYLYMQLHYQKALEIVRDAAVEK